MVFPIQSMSLAKERDGLDFLGLVGVDPVGCKNIGSATPCPDCARKTMGSNIRQSVLCNANLAYHRIHVSTPIGVPNRIRGKKSGITYGYGVQVGQSRARLLRKATAAPIMRGCSQSGPLQSSRQANETCVTLLTILRHNLAFAWECIDRRSGHCTGSELPGI